LNFKQILHLRKLPWRVDAADEPQLFAVGATVAVADVCWPAVVVVVPCVVDRVDLWSILR
jgi:hypothetical protein